MLVLKTKRRMQAKDATALRDARHIAVFSLTPLAVHPKGEA